MGKPFAPPTRRRALAASLLMATPWLHAAPAPLAGVLQHHASLVHASYADTLQAARAMQAAIAAFLAAPDAARHKAAQQAWLAARDLYGQTEAFRFYGGPIDAQNGPEGRLNAWPMDESYVDASPAKGGLVQNAKFAITKPNLARMNERGGEENIATGWHAIEFFLWGPDTRADAPGQRAVADFVDAPFAARRRDYLRVVTELLIDDLASLERAWAPGRANYRARFENTGREGLRRMLVGIGSLSRGELAGERLEVALNTKNQEDEHSCFSDNTHRDAWSNQRGIVNVWRGEYRRADGTLLQGPSPAALLAAQDAALAERLDGALAQSLQLAESLPPPFDQAILSETGRAHIRRLIDSLLLQSQLIGEAAPKLGIQQLKLVEP